MKFRVFFLFSALIVYVFYIADYNWPTFEDEVFLAIPDIQMKRVRNVDESEMHRELLSHVVPVHKGLDQEETLVLTLDTANVEFNTAGIYYATITLNYGIKMKVRQMQIEIVTEYETIPRYVIQGEEKITVELSLQYRDTLTNQYKNNIKVYGLTDEEVELPIYGHDDQDIPVEGEHVIVHDAGVDYTEPGVYAVRYEVVDGRSTLMNFYRSVIVKAPVIPTLAEMEEYFIIDENKMLSCKSTAFIEHNTLYIPGIYHDEHGKNIVLKGIHKNGCSRTSKTKAATALIIGLGFEIIEAEAFKNTKRDNIKTLHIPDTMTYISKEAFSGQSIKSFIIPNTVKTIEKDAFLGLRNLENIVFLGLVENLEILKDTNDFQSSVLIYSDVNIYFSSGIQKKYRQFTSDYEGYETYNKLMTTLSMKNQIQKVRYFEHHVSILMYV